MNLRAWCVARGPWALAAGLVALPLAAQAPLQDNSFLIEEAYNQEHRVLQHISTAELHHGSALYSFTQEWPYR
ncbi:MAG TPA: hypothetical protein VFI13_12685, partial [Gemmatimonadales bacterium]|nr:hypothetical protein [Gemmatimonadales bacterium]